MERKRKEMIFQAAKPLKCQTRLKMKEKKERNRQEKESTLTT